MFTVSPKRADPASGPVPRPNWAATTRSIPNNQASQPRPPHLSASQDRHRALANADHLAFLNAIWTAETAPPANSTTTTSS